MAQAPLLEQELTRAHAQSNKGKAGNQKPAGKPGNSGYQGNRANKKPRQEPANTPRSSNQPGTSNPAIVCSECGQQGHKAWWKSAGQFICPQKKAQTHKGSQKS